MSNYNTQVQKQSAIDAAQKVVDNSTGQAKKDAQVVLDTANDATVSA